ncbi:MAG: hypothetical protein ACOX02_04370 [Acholeplasmatales bacterium]
MDSKNRTLYFNFNESARIVSFFERDVKVKENPRLFEYILDENNRVKEFSVGLEVVRKYPGLNDKISEINSALDYFNKFLDSLDGLFDVLFDEEEDESEDEE